ncbi:MAG: hypothetical protein ACKVJE_22410 [Pseudomonadales bacterium]
MEGDKFVFLHPRLSPREMLRMFLLLLISFALIAAEENEALETIMVGSPSSLSARQVELNLKAESPFPLVKISFEEEEVLQ